MRIHTVLHFLSHDDEVDIDETPKIIEHEKYLNQKFPQLSITLSLEYIRLLSIGQWPDVLTIVTSCGLGSSTVMVHPIIVPFDIAISELVIKF